MVQRPVGGKIELFPRRGRPMWATILLAGSLALGGCEQTQRPTVRQPVPNPTPAPASQPVITEQPAVEIAQPAPAPQAPALSPAERLERHDETDFAAGGGRKK